MIIHANVLITISSYILAVVSAMIVGLVLRLPLLPERPMRHSWTVSIIFPTSVLAIGFTAILFKLGYEGLLSCSYCRCISLQSLPSTSLKDCYPNLKWRKHHERDHCNYNSSSTIMVQFCFNRHMDGTSRKTRC